MEAAGPEGRRARLRRLHLRTAAGYGLVLAALVIPSALALNIAFRAAEQRYHVAASFTRAAARAERLRTLGLEVGLDVRALIIREEPARLARLERMKADFESAIVDLRTQAGPEGAALLAQIDEAAQRYEHAAIGVLALPATERDEAFEAQLIPRMHDLRDGLDGYVAFKHGLIAPAAASADARFRHALEISLASFALAILVSVALAVLTGRRLERDYRREQALADKAERALASRDEILAIVAHDLRSPLGAIALKAGMLRRNPQTANALKQAAAIEAIAMRMAQLVRMLLDAARMEAGRFRIEAVDLQLVPLVRETLDQFSAHAEAKGIQLQLEACPAASDAIVRADRERVIQVLSNLIDNAIRYTSPAGRISVAVDAKDDALSVTVTDGGPGIAPEHLPHVFERFWKADAHGKRGSGLGLYIAKEIVEAHGGRIWAENPPGGGARFSLTLPFAPAVQSLIQHGLRPNEAHATT